MKKVLLLLILINLVGLLFASYIQLGFTEKYLIEVPTAHIPTAKIFEVDNMNFFGVKHDTLMINHIFSLKYGASDKFEFSLFLRGKDYTVDGYFPDSLYTQKKYNDELVSLNVKYSFFKETIKNPAMAVGIVGIEGAIKEVFDSSKKEAWAPYLVLSKSFSIKSVKSIIHFGNGQGEYFHSFSTYDKYFLGFFGGLSVFINDNITLSGEARGANLNACAVYEWDKISLKGGLVHFEEIIMGDTKSGFTFFLSFKYTIDHFAKQAKNRQQIIQQNIVPSTDNSDQLLLDELKQIQEERKKSEKELEELRKLLEE